jgi:hypothetical protein
MFDSLTEPERTALRTRMLSAVNHTSKVVTFTLSITSYPNPLYDMASGTMREMCDLHSMLCRA